jgi:alanyl-tRNA synthetase
VDGAEVDHVAPGAVFEMVVNQTPFYAEQGGQMGDQGIAVTPTGAVMRVTDTQKRADGVYVHVGVMEGEDSRVLNIDDSVALTVDPSRRGALCAHHSATHLLHEALRIELGDHVAQKGSLVAPDRLRFDISHGQPLSAGQIAAVEREVNARIRACTPVQTRVLGIEDAKSLGARALFGEKYGDEVRVVTMGGVDEGAARPWSIELCGGTHVDNTGRIGAFRVLREEGLAAGVRRIEAVCHEAAERHFAAEAVVVAEAGDLLHAKPDEIAARIKALQAERKALEVELGDAKRKLAIGGGAGAAAQMIGDVALTCREVEGLSPKALKAAVNEMLAQAPGIVALGVNDGGKGSVVIGVSEPALSKGVDAAALVRAAAPAVGAKGGGGRPDMAQTGGPNGDGVADALKAVEAAARAALA